MEDQERQFVFVDDEPNILKALQRVFFDDDYDIETFTDPREALEYIKENDVQLIISDQRMPQMTGTELLAEVVKVRPESMRIILTGFADMEAAVDAINTGKIYQFIFKPWNDEELRSTVLRALQHYDLQTENTRLLAELKVKNEELADLNGQLAKKVKERTQLIVKKNLELGKLTKSLENSLVSTVRVAVNMMEISRREISTHARRVASIAPRVAAQLSWGEDKIRDLEIACLMHDIGKLGIPSHVLAKPMEEMNENELRLLKNHTVLGQSMLGAVDAFEHVGRIVRHHHERYDGRGYPDGLSGKDIPEEARLLAICNIYDNLLNAGEEGHSPTFAMKYMMNNQGTLFDPEMVQAFLQTIRQTEEKKEAEEQKLREVMIHELKPGMVLAENLSTGKGIFLLPEKQLLRDTHIQSIQDIQQVDPIAGPVKVYVSD